MMPPPRTHRFRLILAGVDFSRESAQALRYAVAAAGAAGGRVVAIYAMDPLLTAAAARAYDEGTIVKEARADLERFARRTLGADAAKAVECTIALGPARQVLIAEALRRSADLVVVGTTGRSGVSKTFFGSTTEALLRRYAGAVMVVPPRCRRPPAGWPNGSLAAAIANTPDRRATLSAAVRAAAVFGGALTVVDPPVRTGRARWRPAPLLLLAVPRETRLKMFRQGSAAYAFVRRSAVPVIVLHTGRRIGHVEVGRSAA